MSTSPTPTRRVAKRHWPFVARRGECRDQMTSETPRQTGERGERRHGQERCDEPVEATSYSGERAMIRTWRSVANAIHAGSFGIFSMHFHAAIAFPEIEVGALSLDFPAALFNLGGHGSSRFWAKPVPDDEPGRLKAPRHPTHGNRARTESTKESCGAASAVGIRPVPAISLRRSRDCDGALRDCVRRARIARCDPRPHAAPSDRRRRVRRAVFPNKRGAIRCRKQSDTTRRAARK